MTGEANSRPLLLGHRGARASKSLPENTFASFDQALADGCDGFEFDVRLTSDGRAVICHDPAVRGMEIAHASVEQCAGLPVLEEILDRYQDRAFLDIELKVSGLEKIVLDALQNRPLHQGFVVSSFLPEVLKAIRAQDSAIPLGLICETHAELNHGSRLPVEYVIPHYKLVDKALIERLKQAGKKTMVWTVNSRPHMQRFRDEGVDGIISDDTDLLARTLKP